MLFLMHLKIFGTVDPILLNWISIPMWFQYIPSIITQFFLATIFFCSFFFPYYNIQAILF